MTRRRLTAAGVVLVALLLLAAGGIAAATYVEQDDAFCASCHTEPESTYVAHAVETLTMPPGADLASFHAVATEPVRCIDCHGGEGALGRGRALALAAWDAAKFATNRFHQPAMPMSPLPDSACTKCHADSVVRKGFENHFHNKLSDEKAPEILCVRCHTAHKPGEERESYVTRSVAFEQCNFCHQQMGKGPHDLK